MSTNDEKRVACIDEETLVAFLRGELSGDDRRRMESHLAQCAACARKARAYAAVIDRLAAAPEAAPLRDMTEDVLAKLPPAGAARRLYARIGRRALVAAAAALLAAVGAWVVVHSLSKDGATTRDDLTLALGWLADSQEADGSWDPARWGGQDDYRVGLTALALLAFTSVEAHAAEAPWAETADRATRYLLSSQHETGRFGPFFSAMLYNHGIATLALLERSRQSGDASLKEPIGRALRLIVTQQQKNGGWGYLESPPNTSITSWQIQALLLGAGLGWPDAKPSAERGLAWVEGTLDGEGRAGYTKPGDFPNGPEGLTAMASFCLALGEGETARADGRMLRVLTRAAAGAGKDDYVRSYFLAHALSLAELRGRADAGDIADLSGRLRRALADRQVKHGPNVGSWEPSDAWGRAGGRVYATAMAALSLQADERARRLADPPRRAQ